MHGVIWTLHWYSPTFPETSWKWHTCQLTWLCIPQGSGMGGGVWACLSCCLVRSPPLSAHFPPRLLVAFVCTHMLLSFVANSLHAPALPILTCMCMPVSLVVCAHPHLLPLIPATWSPQALICVCIRCIVSEYIYYNWALTYYQPINLDKKFWLVLIYV